MKIRLMFVSNSSSSSSIVIIPKNFKVDITIEDIPEALREEYLEEEGNEFFTDDDLDNVIIMLSELANGNQVNEHESGSTYNLVLKLLDSYTLTSIDSYGGDGSGSIIPITEKDVEATLKKINKGH